MSFRLRDIRQDPVPPHWFCGIGRGRIRNHDVRLHDLRHTVAEPRPWLGASRYPRLQGLGTLEPGNDIALRPCMRPGRLKPLWNGSGRSSHTQCKQVRQLTEHRKRCACGASVRRTRPCHVRRFGKGLVGLTVPGQQLVDWGCWDVRGCGEHIGEPSLRVEAVELGRFDEV